MRALDGLHVEVQSAGLGVGPDGGIARVCEGAGLAVAEAGDVVLVAAEVLLFGGSVVGEGVSNDHVEFGCVWRMGRCT